MNRSANDSQRLRTDCVTSFMWNSLSISARTAPKVELARVRLPTQWYLVWL